MREKKRYILGTHISNVLCVDGKFHLSLDVLGLALLLTAGCSVQRKVLNGTVALTLRFLASPSWEPSEEESAMTDKRVHDEEASGPVSEGPTIKNK